MITKRSISKPDSKKEPGEIAIKQTMTSHHRIARVHYPVLKPPRAPTGPDPRPTGRRRPARGIRKTARTQNGCGWRSGNPKAYPHRSPPVPRTREANDLFHTSTPTPNPGTIPGTRATRRTPDRRPEKLRRKEVIQPHLPVRLPCYDLVPITSLTLDGPIPQGVRPPASGAAHFHDLTGGVYKARERIHRDVADSRLLATPPSRSRVADCDPN